MKYIRLILKYIGRNIVRTFIPIFPVALFMGLFYQQSPTLVFIKDFGETEIMGFGDVFHLLFPDNPLYYFLVIPIFLILLAFSCSYLIAMVYKHFRTGRLSMRMPLANVNHGLHSVGLCIVLFLTIFLIYRVLFGAIVSLAVSLFMPNGIPGVGLIAFTMILGVVTYFSVVYLTIYPVIAASIMLVYGYSFKDALSDALRTGYRTGMVTLIIAYFFPFVLNALVAYVLISFSAPDFLLNIFNVIVDQFLITYIVLFSVMVVFDLQKIERVDLQKLY